MKPIFTFNKEANELDNLRQKRKRLLPAWDKLIGNANFGVKTLTEERKAELIAWHQGILDLDKDSFENVPEEVAYYL